MPLGLRPHPTNNLHCGQKRQPPNAPIRTSKKTASGAFIVNSSSDEEDDNVPLAKSAAYTKTRTKRHATKQGQDQNDGAAPPPQKRQKTSTPQKTAAAKKALKS